MASGTIRPRWTSISTLVEQGAFEETLSALELVVEHLERGRLTMDESIAWYEAGLGLMRRCSHLLEQAELRISALDAENPAILLTTIDWSAKLLGTPMSHSALRSPGIVDRLRRAARP